MFEIVTYITFELRKIESARLSVPSIGRADWRRDWSRLSPGRSTEATSIRWRRYYNFAQSPRADQTTRCWRCCGDSTC